MFKRNLPQTGTPEHIFEWGGGGLGDELQVHMEVCNNGVRGRAPEKFLQSTPYNSVGNALFEYRYVSCLGRKWQIKSLKC